MKEISNPPAVIRAAETLDELALVINSTYAAAEEATRKGLERYREVGLMLAQAKKKCGHGQWLSWLKANVTFSHKHATRYMHLAKVDTVSNLEEAWRVITGRNETEEESDPSAGSAPASKPAPEPRPADPAPKPKEQPAPKSVAKPTAPAPVAKPDEPEPEENEPAPTVVIFPTLEPDPEPEPVKPPKPAPTVDAWGIPIQEHAAEAFATDHLFAALLAKLRECQAALSQIAESAGGKHLATQWERNGSKAGGRFVLSHLENTIAAVARARPTVTDCPYAFNPESPHPENCTLCRNLRWLPSPKGFQIPPTLTAAMKSHYGIADTEAA